MSRTRTSESGFTLAGLIVLLTIISIVAAYTVPRMWSISVARDRDRQTLFAMKQYARAIKAFYDKNHTLPVSLDQLKQARNPRFFRGKGELVDPLTGQVDWIVVPATAAPTPNPGPGPPPPGPPPPGPSSRPGPLGQPGGAVGPMAGVRPNKTGKSYLSVNGADSYEQWSYTVTDLEAEIAQRRNAMMVK